MVLATTALSYGTCWIGAFKENEAKMILKIPEAIAVIVLLPIGGLGFALIQSPIERLEPKKLVETFISL